MKYKYLIKYQYKNYSGEYFLSTLIKVLEHEINEEDVIDIQIELAHKYYGSGKSNYMPTVLSFSRLAMTESD